MIKVNTAIVNGIEGCHVKVEVDIKNGIPNLIVVGLGDTTIKEAGERIKGAIINSGFPYPRGRITVNLSPADVHKRGSHMELAVALGILAFQGIIRNDLQDIGVFGELSLSGDVVKIKGLLPMAKKLEDSGVKRIIMPIDNASESCIINQETIMIRNLTEAIDYINNGSIPKWETSNSNNDLNENLNFYQVKGQENAKRALTVSAAGNHGVIMIGSPGTGKTMLAKRMPTILPKMSKTEIVETASVYSVLGLLDKEKPFMTERPFRSPYYRITSAGLLGGGSSPKPGEISLANNGVLFLDEIGEFSRNVLDGLRTPLEEKKIVLNRKNEVHIFPANFLLVGASNPCKCGYYGNENRVCNCTQTDIDNYRRKISGPLADRIDIHVLMDNIDYETYISKAEMTSEEIKEQVIIARSIQKKRYLHENISFNSQLSGELLNKYCQMDKDTQYLLRDAYEKLKLNPRTCEKVVKVARTIADLQESDNINTIHMAEALSYRNIDRLYGRPLNEVC